MQLGNRLFSSIKNVSSVLGPSSFAASGFVSLALKVGSAGLTFVMLALFAHVLSVDDYGRFAFAFSVTSFLGIVAALGFHRTILRWVPELAARGDRDALRRVLLYSTENVLLGSLLVTLALIGIAAAQGTLDIALLAACPLIVATALSEYLAAALRGLGSLVGALAPKDLLWRLGGALLGGVLLSRRMSTTPAILLGFLSVLLIVLIAPQAVLLWRRSRSSKKHVTAGAERSSVPRDRRSALRIALPMWGATILFNAAQHVDVIVVGAVLSFKETAAYFAVARTANLLSFIVFAIDMVASPRVALLHHDERWSELQALLRHVSMIVLIPTLLGFLFFAGAGSWILGAFGAEFRDQAPLLIVMSGTFLVGACCGPTESFMQMTGNEGAYFRIVIGTYACSLVLMAVSMPFIGIWGAAAGHFMAVAVRGLLVVRYARRRLALDPSILNLFSMRRADKG